MGTFAGLAVFGTGSMPVSSGSGLSQLMVGGRKPWSIAVTAAIAPNPQAAPMVRQMSALGLKDVKLLGGDTLCSPEMAKLGGDAVG